MPATDNSRGRRKVRCPRCTFRLIEPSTPVYQCPICATLLEAKGSPGDLKGELLPGNGRDSQSIQQTPEGDRSKLENSTVINEPNKDAETVQQIPVEGSKQENSSVVKDPGKKQGSQGMDFIGEENKSFEEEGGSKQDNSSVHNDLSKTQGLQGLDYVEKECKSFEGDNRPSLIPPVEGNASDACSRFRENILRWSKLEKDALVHAPRKSPKQHGTKYMNTGSATPDGLEGHEFQFDVPDTCCEATQEVVKGDNVRDAESIQQTLNGGSKPNKDAERIQQTLEGLYKQENATVINDPSKKQEEQGMDHMEKELESLEGDGDSKLENATVLNDLSKKQQHQEMAYIERELESSKRDNGLLHSSAVQGSLNDSHAKLIENSLHENLIDAESIKQMPEQWSKLEKGDLVNERSEKQRHQDMEYVEKESVKPYEMEGRDFELDVTNNHEATQQLVNGHNERDAESIQQTCKGRSESNKNAEIEGRDFKFDVTDNHEATQQIVSGHNGRDAERTHQPFKGRSEPSKKTEIIQQANEGGSNEEKATAINDPKKKQGQQGMDYVEEGCKSLEVEGEPKQENDYVNNDSSKKQGQQGMDYMEKECGSCEGDSGLLHMSQAERRTDKILNETCGDAENDAIMREPSNEQRHPGMDCLEKESAAPDGIVGQALDFDKTDNCEATNQVVNSHGGRDPESFQQTLEVRSKHNEDPGIIQRTLEAGSKHNKDPGILQQTLDEGSKQEYSTVINDHREKQGQQGMDYMEKEHKSLEEGGSKQENATVTNDPREKIGQQGMDYLEKEHKSLEEPGSKQKNATFVNDPKEKQGQQELDHMEKEHESLEEEGSKQDNAAVINNHSKKNEQQGVDCMEKECISFEGDDESLHISPVDGSSNDSHDRLKQKFRLENCVDPEILEWRSKLEKDAVINEPSKRQRQQGMEYMEKESATLNGYEWQHLHFDVTDDWKATQQVESGDKGRDAESIQQTPEGVSKPDRKAEIFRQTLEGGSKQENDSVIDDPSRKQRQQGMDNMEKECKSFNGDNGPLHFPPVKENPDEFNSRLTKNSGHENCFDLENIKLILERCSEIDKDAGISEHSRKQGLQGMEYMEGESVLPDRIEGQDCDFDVIDNGEAVQQEVSGYSERDYSEALLHEEDTDKVTSLKMKGSELDYSKVNNVEAETPSSIEYLVDLGHPINDKYPSEVADDRHLDKLCGSLTESGLFVSKGASKGTKPEARCDNEMTQEVSECTRQRLHGADVAYAALVDEDEKGNCRKQESAAFLSSLTNQSRESNLEASFRYADVWTKKLGNTEALESLDMSLCDWQSLKTSDSPEDPKENCMDAGFVDEKRVSHSDMSFLSVSASKGREDVIFVTVQGENTKLKQGLLPDEDESVIHSEALSDLNSTDSGSAILGTESKVHIEKPTVPIKTAAMQVFLQRTEKEVTDQMHLHNQESEAKIYKAAYVEEYQPDALLSTTMDKLNELAIGKVVFSNQRMDASNGHLSSAANTLMVDTKPNPLKWSEKVNRSNDSTVRADGHLKITLNLNQSQENDEAVVQETVVAGRHTLSNISASNLFGDHVDLCKAGLNRSAEGMAVNEGRLMNAVSFEQPDHAHADLQEQSAVMWSQKYQTDHDVMDQGPGYSMRGPANSIYSYSEMRSQESTPQFNPSQKYLSNPLGLSPLNVSSRPYSFQAPSQALMSPAQIQEHAFSHSAHQSVSPVCTLCIQQAHMHQPQLLQNMMQHHRAACIPQFTSMTYQPSYGDGWESPQAHHMLPSSYGDPSDRFCQTGSASPQAQIKFRPLLLKRYRHFPPLPQEGAAPYVLCQECDRLLKVPQYLPPNGGNTQKLRCGACGKISKFSIYQQTKNFTPITSSQSSNVSSEIHSKSMALSTPWLVQSPTTCNVYPETAIAHPPGHRSLFSSNDHGRRLLIPKSAQRVESPRHKIMGGRTALGSSSDSHYERVHNQLLNQTDSSARIISTTQNLDYMYQPRSIAGIMQGQEFSRSRSRDGVGDRLLNASGTNDRSYLSSFPPTSVHGSSPLRNSSDHLVKEDQKRRVALGGRKVSNDVYLHASVNDQEGPGFQPSTFSNDYFQKGFNERKLDLSTVTMQDSLHWHSTENVDNEDLGRNQGTWTETRPQWQVMGPGYSRSSSKGSTVQLRKGSAAPGSPLTEHFDQGSLEVGPSLWQRVSGNGVGPVPWSPAAVSPLYDHFEIGASSDFDQRSYQKERDSSSKLHGPVPQDVSRGPKYFAGLLRKSLKDTGKGGQGNNNRKKVMVNGKLISDVMVRKAEEKAGVINPGSYWYDSQAGFWGVTGGPCLGIIPPNIKELNFPLAKDCAGGRTGVLVNGRELHHKDLQVLAGRGLPTTPGKAYIVDILGNVLDSASGQLLRSLGRLAPTIEKNKCGYGMSQPSEGQSG